MFDRSTYYTTSSPSKINMTINEHRAPTDDSIKIYEELKTKAFDSIIRSVKISNSLFEANVIISKDRETFSTIVRCIFKINDQKFDEHIILENPDLYRITNDNLAKLIYDKFIEIISERITIEAYKPMFVEIYNK